MRNGGNTDLSEAQEVLGKSILPMFGLDNESATYPFVDLWGLPHGSLARAQELAKALPTDFTFRWPRISISRLLPNSSSSSSRP